MTDQQRDRAAIIAPPPLLTVLCIAAGIVAGRFKPLRFVDDAASARFAGCAALVLVAASLIGSGLGTLIKHREHPSPYKRTDAIVDSGIYRFTRNPIYLGFLIIVLAVGVGANNAWLFVSFAVLFLLLHFGVVKPEERYLSVKFGDRYADYRRKVRRWV